MALNQFLYIAVRTDRTNSSDHYDVTSLSYSREETERKVRMMNEELPHWAIDNPVSRITLVNVEEAT